MTRAFTLIELLLVIAIVALLVGILLPALGSARSEARATKCSASIRAIGQGLSIYMTDYKFVPPSYVYPDESTGMRWSLENQYGSGSDTGYLHWSYNLFDSGTVPGDAFQCPAVWHGGAPRANPGFNADDWEPEQQNDTGGNVGTADPEDRQVPRTAYTANDAIMSRNKFVDVTRPYRMVRPADIDGSRSGASKTILATEFLSSFGWKSLYKEENGGVVKSHRPVSPFIGAGTGALNPFDEPLGGTTARFFYANPNRLKPSVELGQAMIESGDTTLNAVGRHHPPEKGTFGGTVNFLFVDGHVERLSIRETLEKRLWGDRYFSLTGNNRVDDEKTK